MATIEIKHRWNGNVLFTYETDEQNSGIALRAALEAAVAAGSNLSCSNLSSSNLSGSNLSRSDLSCSNLSGSNLSGSNLSGSDLSGSNLSGSNLSGSNLSGSDLSGSNLSRSNLSGSNLSGAKWAEGVTISRIPLQIYGLHWAVTILDQHMQIGCQLHSLAAWDAFNESEIAAMDGRNALRFWRAHKAALLALAASNGRGVEADQQAEG